MDNASLQRIKDTIAKSSSIIVAVSANPTVDQMAGALSLYLTFSNLNKKVSVLSPTAPIVELSSLVGIDKVKASADGSSGDLVVSFPYREGEIEKVSYTIDDGFLNIVVKAGEQGLTFSESDVLFKRGADKADLIFTVGVSSMDEISSLLSDEAFKDTITINIDNSSQNTGYGDVVLVSPKFSSLSEQVADLLLNLEMDIDIDVAQNLMSGVTTATENFQNPNTSYLAFEIAAILMKRGAVRTQPQSQAQQLPRRDQRPDQSREPRAHRPQQQNQPRQEQKQDNRGGQKPPSDWLTPKVYKGSTSV